MAGQIPPPVLVYKGEGDLQPLVDQFITSTEQNPGAMSAVLRLIVHDPLVTDFEQLEVLHRQTYPMPDTPARAADRETAFKVVKALFESEADRGLKYDRPTERAFSYDEQVGYHRRTLTNTRIGLAALRGAVQQGRAEDPEDAQARIAGLEAQEAAIERQIGVKQLAIYARRLGASRRLGMAVGKASRAGREL